MALTNAQKALVKTYILADPVLSTKVSGPGTDYGFIAATLSSAASPAVKAWKTAVPPTDSDDAVDYSTFDSIVAGKRDSWGFFLAFPRDFTRSKVRKWITDVFGNATANSNAEAVLLAGTENAKLVETIIGGTSRNTGTVTALDRSFQGTVSIQDVSDLLHN